MRNFTIWHRKDTFHPIITLNQNLYPEKYRVMMLFALVKILFFLNIHNSIESIGVIFMEKEDIVIILNKDCN